MPCGVEGRAVLATSTVSFPFFWKLFVFLTVLGSRTIGTVKDEISMVPSVVIESRDRFEPILRTVFDLPSSYGFSYTQPNSIYLLVIRNSTQIQQVGS
jgi:hypothetical protein